MTVNYGQIVRAIEGLSTVQRRKISPESAYKLAMLIEILTPHITKYGSLRNELAASLGTGRPPTPEEAHQFPGMMGGLMYDLSPENLVRLQDGIAKLEETVIEIGQVPMITLKDLGSEDIEPVEIRKILPFIMKESFPVQT